jgi:hypothetical protein
MYLSIPLAAAVVIGFLVFGVTYLLLPIPTMEQIRTAPDYDTEKNKLIGPGVGGLTPEKLKGLEDILQGKEPPRKPSSSSSPQAPSDSGAVVVKDEDEGTGPPTTPATTPAPEHRPNLVDRETYRKHHVIMSAADMEKALANTNKSLEVKRRNLIILSQKAGAWAGIISGVIGYGLLVYYFYSASRRARIAWEQQKEQLRASAAAQQPAPVEQHYAPPPVPPPGVSQPPAAPEPVVEPLPRDDVPIQAPPGQADVWAAAEGKYEPYEAPVDISEIERTYDETVEREKKQGGNPEKT